MSGPSATSLLYGSPTRRRFARSAKRATYASAIRSWTRWRLDAMQICPWLKKEPKAPADEARSRSASSNTMNGEFPPSSSETRLSVRPAASPTSRPTAVEPVNEIISTFGSTVRAAPGSASPGSTWNTSSGKPARCNATAIKKPPETGVCTSGFSTTVFPRASAGATERIERISGAFHAVWDAQRDTLVFGRRLDHRPRLMTGECGRLAQLADRDVDFELGLPANPAGLTDIPGDHFFRRGGEDIGRTLEDRGSLGCGSRSP